MGWVNEILVLLPERARNFSLDTKEIQFVAGIFNSVLKTYYWLCSGQSWKLRIVEQYQSKTQHLYQVTACEISSSYSCVSECSGLLGCDAMLLAK